jgi:mercuric ion binding protein
MKPKFSFIILILALVTLVAANQSEIKETSVKVLGNCDECKDRIETALDIEEVKFVKWNKNSKQLKLAYESSITLDSLKQRIAAVGHDTEGFSAADSIYSKLPGCCLYRDNPDTH